jgi:hypothetical protein
MFLLHSQREYPNIIILLLQTVIVGDDCALPPPRGIAGRRGLAGTILVHKVLSFSIHVCGTHTHTT